MPGVTVFEDMTVEEVMEQFDVTREQIIAFTRSGGSVNSWWSAAQT
jgi:hypothetical protein